LFEHLEILINTKRVNTNYNAKIRKIPLIFDLRMGGVVRFKIKDIGY